MKKFFMVCSALLMTVSYIASGHVYALDVPDKITVRKAPVSQVYLDYKENPENYSIAPSLIDKSENAAIKIQENLPEKYDMRDKGLVTSVKNQGIYGTCWAFAAVSSMETSLVERNPFIDISEWHTAYYGTLSDDNINIYNYNNVYIPESADSTDFEKLFSLGGSSSLIINNVSGWQGPADESRFPYDAYIFENENERYSADYHVSDICMAFQNVYPGQRENVINEVKDAIYNGNSVNVYFSSYEAFLNEETSAYFGVCENIPDYMIEEAYSIMHEVTIVGWDDNYSRENFGETAKPENDGAWLIKNSWGKDIGESGYYWLSYEDQYLNFDVSYSLEYAQEHDNIYQHNISFGGWIYSYSVSESGEAYISSVFTAKGDEYINGIGFYTTDNGTQYQADIYTGDFNGSAVLSGKPVLSASGTEKYAGYHTVDFSDGAYIENGQEYTVVIKLSNPLNKYAVPMSEVPEIYNFSDNSAYENISFMSADGINWTDTMSSDENYPYGLVCCNVFTDNADKIKFSDYSPCVSRESKISLSSYGSSDIYYSYDKENWILYSEPLRITENTDIYASFSPDDENYIMNSYELMPEYGDVDRDGEITSYDALEVLQHICGISEIGDVMQKYADVNCSWDITSADALLILQYTAGLVSTLP